MADNAHPEVLASAAWLADRLDDPSVRVVGARFDLRVTSAGTLATVPGRDAYGEGHIPGAVFVDVMSDLAEPEDPLVLLSRPRFEALMGRLGISDGTTTVVVYDDRGGTWAARLWWALRYYGHDAVKLLDGGLTRWEPEDRSIECQVTGQACLYPAHRAGHIPTAHNMPAPANVDPDHLLRRRSVRSLRALRALCHGA